MDFEPSTVAEVITAGGILITAVTLWVTAAVALHRLRKLSKRINDIRTLLTQQQTASMLYQERLIEALTAAGVHVPRDESLCEE